MTGKNIKNKTWENMGKWEGWRRRGSVVCSWAAVRAAVDVGGRQYEEALQELPFIGGDQGQFPVLSSSFGQLRVLG